MNKRTSFADLGIGPAASSSTDEAAPSPTSALLHTVAGNPDNPRDKEDDPELAELTDSYREVGQLQPIGVVSREVYLRHFPQHRETVGNVEWVVVNGNRRLEAARRLRWARVDIVVRDHLGDGDDGGSIDEAVMIENIHRKNLAPLREAQFLQRMVERHGSQRQVAKRIGKTQTFVSQRLSLLRLEPEIRQAVDAGELKVKEAQRLAGVEGRDAQMDAWRKGPAESAGDSRAITSVPRQESSASSADRPARVVVGDSPAITSASELATEAHDEPAPTSAPTAAPASPAPVAGVLEEPAAPTAEDEPAEPGERFRLPPIQTVEAMPWGRPLELLHVMQRHMTPQHFTTLIEEGRKMM